MGFRVGSWMKIWEIQPKSQVVTSIKGSISKKNKSTGDYETEFCEYCSCLGANIAQKAANLQVGQTIQLKDIDVTSVYDKVKQQKYINYKIFDFDVDNTPRATAPRNTNTATDDGIVDLASYEGYSEDIADEGLPF